LSQSRSLKPQERRSWLTMRAVPSLRQPKSSRLGSWEKPFIRWKRARQA